jgi:hypothetical protein
MRPGDKITIREPTPSRDVIEWEVVEVGHGEIPDLGTVPISMKLRRVVKPKKNPS